MHTSINPVGCSGSALKTYRVKKIEPCDLGGVDFSKAEPGVADEVRVESSHHHPHVRFALLHDSRNLYLRFDVADCYVKVVHSGFHAPVYKDSCVEFFVRPRPDCGYFNFEVNAGGALLLSYVEDWSRTAAGFKKATSLADELCRKIEIISSLPHIIDPEITTPTDWNLSLKIPLCVLEAHTGEVNCLPATRWRANFYKCADGTSHPHWLSWSPVKELNFHAPECFGELQF